MHSTVPNLSLQHSQVQSARDTNISITTSQSSQRDAKEILKEGVAFGALFDSHERFDPPKCHPETRKGILDAIDRWASSEDPGTKPIFWLRGAAGAGKSAVAQTLAERWDKAGFLAATFFFSRTVDWRNDSSRLIATLAYQISLTFPSAWPRIERALLDDIGLFKKSLRSQMIELVVRPLELVASEINSRRRTTRAIIVIDGLDECCKSIDNRDHEIQQREVLDSIAEIAKTCNLPLRFLIASRPERQIRSSFSDVPLAGLTQVIDLSNIEGSNEDIRCFVICSFDWIRSQNPHLGSSWPPNSAIDVLVEKSSGHFIYAATAMKHIARPRFDPNESLRTVLNVKSGQNSTENPFAELDALYMLILQAIAPSSLSIVFQVFQILCFDTVSTWTNIFTSTLNLSPSYIEKLLLIPPSSLLLHLTDLHSILNVPEQREYASRHLLFSHASFSEFLTSPSRSLTFYLDKPKEFEQLQLKRLGHIYARALSSESADSTTYGDFILVFCSDLKNTHRSEPLLEGLQALVAENSRFCQYVRQINLLHLGTARNQAYYSKYFLNIRELRDHRNTLIEYLTKFGVKKARILYSADNIKAMLATDARSLNGCPPEQNTKTELPAEKPDRHSWFQCCCCQ